MATNTMPLPADDQTDYIPWRDGAIWYATGYGWRVASGGTLDPAWNRGDPDGRGTPSTAAEEQVRFSPLPSKKNNVAFPPTIAPAASQAEAGTHVAAARADRPTHRLNRLAERISWLEWELAHPPPYDMPYVLHVGPDHDNGKSVGVHQRIRVALTDMRRERERALLPRD